MRPTKMRARQITPRNVESPINAQKMAEALAAISGFSMPLRSRPCAYPNAMGEVRLESVRLESAPLEGEEAIAPHAEAPMSRAGAGEMTAVLEPADGEMGDAPGA